MSLKQVVLLDITGVSTVTGVDRYMEMLTEYLSCQGGMAGISVLRVCLSSDNNLLGIKLKEGKVKCLYVPLPCFVDTIIDELFWMKRYGEQVIRLVLAHIDLRLRTIIHIHTLNLIDIAISLKDRMEMASIVTHLHCIPWKGLINKNPTSFTQKYSVYYGHNDNINPAHFSTNRSEINAYTKADRIVCLTDCAQEFVVKMCADRTPPITLIPNGLSDLSSGLTRSFETSGKLNVVFVGSLSRGKGLLHALDAMRIAQSKGIELQLDVAGAPVGDVLKHIREDYPDLAVNIHGTLALTDVVALYRQADVGIISSLQEQCSYVAIEMAMMSLPIITTAIDGLDEMFTDGVNALKVPVSFSRVTGLNPDVAYMAECLLRFARDKSLRVQLGNGARSLFLEHYTLDRMGEKTIAMYKDMFNLHE